MAEFQVDMGAVRFNIGLLRAMSAPTSRVMLVCKSDFYGLGLETAARMEPWVDCLAVGSFAEALSLLAATASKDIVVLYPPTRREALLDLLAAGRRDGRVLPTVLPTREHAQCLLEEAAHRGSPLPCYVLAPQLGDRFWSQDVSEDVLVELVRRPGVSVRGVFTHMAEASSLNDEEVARRIRDWTGRMAALCPGVPLSVADSHLAARGQGLSLGFCRVGLFPLGVVEPKAAEAHGLRQALRLTARVVNGYSLPAPLRVGYGRDVVPEGRSISILDVGFASGLPFEFFRHCAAAGPEGRRYRFLPAPWMEYSGILADGGPLPVGSEVELFGIRQGVAAQGRLAGLPAEALFCHLSRVPRKIVLE